MDPATMCWTCPVGRKTEWWVAAGATLSAFGKPLSVTLTTRLHHHRSFPVQAPEPRVLDAMAAEDETHR